MRLLTNFIFSIKEIVLSQLQDEFYKENIYSNFGDLAINVKKKVQELSVHAQANQNIQTIGSFSPLICPHFSILTYVLPSSGTLYE